MFERWGLLWSVVDLTNLEALEQAFRSNTRLVWAETPSNPMLKVTDLRAVAGRSHAAGASLIVDGTWATPLLQHPFEEGADLARPVHRGRFPQCGVDAFQAGQVKQHVIPKIFPGQGQKNTKHHYIRITQPGKYPE